MSAFGVKADIFHSPSVCPLIARSGHHRENWPHLPCAGLFLCYSRAMTPDKDIYQAAKILIDKHGDDAVIEAAMIADKMFEAGDLDGQAVWNRILRAVEELRAGKRPEGEGVH